MVKSNFYHYKSMDNIKCHSNNSYLKGTKNTIYVEAIVLNKYASDLWFLRRGFFNIFSKITLFVALAINQIQVFEQKSPGT